jgi:hypothetical protein
MPRFVYYCVFVCLWVLLFPDLGKSSSIIPPINPGELVRDSEHVVLAKALGTASKFRGRTLVTVTKLEVLQSVKGFASGRMIEIETPGGISGDIGLSITGSPEFEVGRSYLLFLREGSSGELRPAMLSYGVMILDGGITDGILKPVDQTWQLERVPRKDRRPVELIRPYRSGAMMRHLRQVSDGTDWNSAGLLADDYPIQPMPGGMIENLISPGCSYLSYEGSPIRWNRFDSGQSVRFYISDTATNLQQTSVQAGLILWSGLEDLKFEGKMDYGGKRKFEPKCVEYESAADALLDEDGAFLVGDGMVQFNDPCDEIPDLTQSGGILAFGGTFFYLNTHAYNSLNWRTSALAFVVVNNGSEALLGPIQYNQMMAHEIGHTLGFGHHTTEPALMNAFCCNPLSVVDVSCAILTYGTLPPNDPPVIANPLDDITLYYPGASFVRSLTQPKPVFTDPDGDPMVYSVLSLEEGIVYAEMASLTAIRLHPNNVGEVVVLVRATDPRGAYVTMELNVIVEPKINVVPEIVRTPDPVFMNEDAVRLLELEGSEPYVIDKDGDKLVYSVISQHPNIVTGEVNGTLVRIIGRGPGVGKINITADDQSGGKVDLEVPVTVNGKPRLQYTPQPIVLVAQSAFGTFNIVQPQLFTDPEGGALTYSITNNAPLFFEAVLIGTTITLNPKTPGSGLVTVRATDVAGNVGAFGLTVNVLTRPNKNPVVANHPGTFGLRAGDVVFEYDLEGEKPVFTDPDSDALTYSAISSLNRVATVSIEGSKLRVTPLETGSASLTVFATDDFGGFASLNIPVAVGVSVALGEEYLPESFDVGNAYPNPFNPATVIPIRQASHEVVQIMVYDVMGRLVFGKNYGQLQPGVYNIEIPLVGNPSGVYIVSVKSGSQLHRQRVTLLK